MRVVWIFTGILAAASAGCFAPAEAAETPEANGLAMNEPATKLVREVVYNELHDHDAHGFWRYWVEHRSASNGRPLDEQGKQLEEARLRELLHSPGEQASHRQAYHEDENRIGRILTLLPDAFLFEDAGQENDLRHMRFRPNPAYSMRSIEAHIFHAMKGDLWLDARMKRLVRLNGALMENVDFGFGLFGRLYKGGWFQMQRTRVSATEWKTERLEVHMNGRAMLFRTIARETSEVRSGFEAVPPRMSLEQGMRVLEDKDAARTLAAAGGRVAPAALVKSK